MDKLKEYICGAYKQVAISFDDKKWHVKGGIPNGAGWYFIKTDAPLEVIKRQKIWAETYTLKKSGKKTRVKNYNLQERADRYSSNLSSYWNINEVYSGLASNLMSRAKDHTFGDPGTGSLCLSRYPELKNYKWSFNYLILDDFIVKCEPPDMILHLGEQLWRAGNGWPILCAE